ncbi:unnamed protein product [Chrysodeixis includens]|uniref:RRM domain-containing protein n=1 Tax=Chrysodeixis includens TaxID=689277 RepID=A0A9P0FS96_CHRIL|nr:unnamed protein product [Chrysodeixis includens]
MQGMGNNRRERSRSPTRIDNGGRRRDIKPDISKSNENSIPVMNPIMMANMYPQANMMMASGMYPNMMMPGAMMSSSMMPAAGMDMMSGAGMEMVPQGTMDVSAIAGQSMAPTPASTMDMSMMMVDPTMMGMYSNMGGDLMHDKKEIVFKHAILIPPNPAAPQPPRRTKPPGCRTIFVGGLPDKIRESTVREIFETYGRIHTLRLSKKNFCHIRFDREECVDQAMMISGYRIKLTDVKPEDDVKEENDHLHTTSGWLHVDYALSRDDQNDYERRQRQVLRAQQAQMQQLNAQQEISNRSATTYRRSPSPVRIQPFSNAALVQLAEKLKNEEHFYTTLPTLLAWLERGECSKKNANQFYSMIQATNAQIRRLFNEKMQAEEELQECRERVKNHIAKVIEQLEQVGKVFAASTHQRVWDHFTKPQRKNIETWQKMTQEFNALKEEFNEKFLNDDGDMNGYGSKMSSDLRNEDVQQLKRENESLQFQLEAYINEVDVIKLESQKEMEKFKAQFIARQALQGAMDKNPPLPSPIVKPPPPPPLPEEADAEVNIKEVVEAGCGEAKLIGIMSAFLQVHPQGASLDYVVSYVRAIFPHVTQATIHHVLQKHNDVFERSTSGVGANIENRWSFIAFKSAQS